MALAILRISSLKCFVIPYMGSHGEKLCRNKSSLMRSNLNWVRERSKDGWKSNATRRTRKVREIILMAKPSILQLKWKHAGKTEDN